LPLHCRGVADSALAVTAFSLTFPLVSSFATSTTTPPFSDTCSFPPVPNPIADFPAGAAPSAANPACRLHGPLPVQVNELACSAPATESVPSICTLVLNSFNEDVSRSSQFVPSPTFPM